MPASYPTSAKAFTTKSDGAGNTILAAHVNDLQLEVTAIETDLLAAFSGGLAAGVTAGNWTPTILSAAGGAATYTTQSGTYLKIGRLVYVWGDVTLATKGTLAAGQARLGGFPFTAVASASMPLVVGFFSGMTTALTWLGGHVYEGSATLADLYHLPAAATATAATQVSDIGATVRIMCAAVYRASA